MTLRLAAIATALTLAGAVMGGGTRAEEAALTGNPEAGAKVFKKCMACHETGPEAKTKVGPVLTGVVGRHAGGVEGFAYSDAMIAKGAEGLIWTPENLDPYLKNPKAFVPGAKMTFAGLKKDQERTDVIAYLATFP